MMQPEKEIRDLLVRLNRWEKDYGTAHRNDVRLKDKGEANARIASLKKTLTEKGALFYWNGAEYVLESMAGAGQGKELASRSTES